MDEPLVILLPTDADALAGAVRAAAPDAEILTRADLDADPAAVGRVTVVYGRLKPEQFADASRLQWLHCTAAGIDWAQHPAVRAHPCVVTNSRFHGPQVCEQLWAMLLMLVRGVHDAYRSQLAGEWESPTLPRIDSLPGRRICILGLGVIGRYAARIAAAHEMDVVGVRRREADAHIDNVRCVYPADRLDAALAGSHVLLNVLPGAEHTDKLIGAAQLDLLADGAYVLNGGRGRTIDTDALVAALESGKLGGAGLDVTDPEPLPPGHALWTVPNVIITAHYGGVIGDYAARAADVFLANLPHFLAGRALPDAVDKDAGY